MQISKLGACGFLLAAAFLQSGCAPTMTVENKASFPVRAVVSMPGQGRQVVSVSPGEFSGVEMGKAKRYRATVIKDQEWIEYAKLTRKVLNDSLANSDQLTGAQLLEVIRRLKDIALRMAEFERAGSQGATCGDAVNEEKNPVVIIRTSTQGALTVSCQ